MAKRYGADNRHIWDPRDLESLRAYQGDGAGAGFWLHDRGGSLNAVCGFLRTLGARWYMPGDIGAVIPERRTVPLPDVDQTVRPDFALRLWLGHRTKGDDWPGLIWELRIGMDTAYETIGFGGTHGLGHVISRDAMKAAPPDNYALVNRERVTAKRGIGLPCFSSKGMEDEAVVYLRFGFDTYDEPTIPLSSPDGLRKCQCDQCGPVSVWRGGMRWAASAAGAACRSSAAKRRPFSCRRDRPAPRTEHAQGIPPLSKIQLGEAQRIQQVQAAGRRVG